MKRVALVTLVTGRIPPGVLQSIRGQARLARAAGLPIDYLLVNGERSGDDDALRLEQYAPSRLGSWSDRLFRLRRLRSLKRLEQYHALLLRYPLGLDLDPLALFRGGTPPIATIHHTKELEELLTAGQRAGAYARWCLERVNGPRILRRVAGIVGVTDEIRRYELSRAGVDMRSATVANGIDVQRVAKTGFVPFDGRSLRLFFVASDPSPWHGIDRLRQSIEAWTGSVKIRVDIVGNQNREAGTCDRLGDHEIWFHGTLRGAELDRVAAHANVAVASLGLYRKLLREACLLKTREYLARGLPVIYGYEDVDVPDDAWFAHKVENSAALIDFDAVMAFATRLASRPGAVDEIRTFAEQHLDWASKVGRLVKFAQTL